MTKMAGRRQSLYNGGFLDSLMARQLSGKAGMEPPHLRLQSLLKKPSRRPQMKRVYIISYFVTTSRLCLSYALSPSLCLCRVKSVCAVTVKPYLEDFSNEAASGGGVIQVNPGGVNSPPFTVRYNKASLPPASIEIKMSASRVLSISLPGSQASSLSN